MKLIHTIATFSLLTLSLSASAFTIKVPANGNSGISNEKVTVSCDRPMSNQSLQMQCTLPGQSNYENAIVNFTRDGKKVGIMYLNGNVNNNDEYASLTNGYSEAPYVYTYQPELQLHWTTEQDTSLSCEHITTRTAFCKVTSGDNT